MATVKELTIKRGQLKSQVSRFHAFVKSVEEHHLMQLPDRIKRIEEVYRKFEEVQELLEQECISKQLDETDQLNIESRQQEERDMFETSYFEAIGMARSLVKTYQENSNNMVNSVPVNQVPRLQVKLPTLSLPTFNGNYDQWLLFKDSFTSLIDSNAELTNIQKFQYLRSSLRGEALEVIQALETSEANYDMGWCLLQERYENHRLIINVHMKELFELPNVLKGSYVTLRQFIDKIRTHLRALHALNEPVDQWSTILIYLVGNKLDSDARRDWEEQIGKREVDPTKGFSMPTMNEFLDFLSQRAQTLELIEGSNKFTGRHSLKQVPERPNHSRQSIHKVHLASTLVAVCAYCQGPHFIFRCERFLRLTIAKRQGEVKRLRLCINCLKENHFSRDCSSSTCRKCTKKHNTLLHEERVNVQNNIEMQETTLQPSKSLTSKSSVASPEASQHVLHAIYKVPEPCITYAVQHSSPQVLLSTAQVYIRNPWGKGVRCRALLDPGSQSNLITRELVQALQLPCTAINLPISGVSQTRAYINQSTQVTLKSMHNSFTTTLDCLVLDTITERLPQVQLNINAINIPSHLHLADPEYHKPGKIDLLIGAGLFWKLLCVGQVVSGKQQPMLQKTLLGWILGGELFNTTQPKDQTSCHLLTRVPLDAQLERFWSMEEFPDKKLYSKEEQYCEEYFQKTVQRDSDGRFIVRLPTDTSVKLGDSADNARKRLFNLERRLVKQPELLHEYSNFLQDYQKLGHMTPTQVNHYSEGEETFYLPHHPVIRAANLTTKLRVVFDGSSKTSNGTSLNDKLLVGPNLQEDISEILMRFRTHQIVMTADIAMMYRQITVAEEDRPLQMIFWRKDASQPVQSYTLNTVTYGTSCAPFLAMRCLKQLAVDEGASLPEAASALLNDFYMDDLITGCNSLKEAQQLQSQLMTLLARGQFPLRKWRSNDKKILSHLSQDNTEANLLVLDKQEPLKTLGLLWNSKEDVLQFSVSLTDSLKPTKRHILSMIAKIYDPLGLIGPILITAKFIMQQLWKLELGWDESIPQALYTEWCTYYHSLSELNQLRIHRNVNPGNTSLKIDLYGFSDASERGYGSCVYCTYLNAAGRPTSSLMCSKSRVAPLKTVSLPRLELCAALLLVRLIKVIRHALGDKIVHTYLWTDSTIVLSWIKTSPHTLKTFVANRVSEIQGLSQNVTWNHVMSQENPADLLSRGATVTSLLQSNLWWCGPSWIGTPDKWPKQPAVIDSDLPEVKIQVLMTRTDEAESVLPDFSSYHKLQRVIAYCHRFIQALQRRFKPGPLTTEELSRATTSILKLIQRERFAKEVKDLQAKQSVSKKSSLLSLSPFLDNEGLIRVGGRLRHAHISTDQKHPIVLPSHHRITTLIVRAEHVRLLHCGPEQLLCSLRLHFWPISGRREAKKVTGTCIPCFRYKPRVSEVKMGDLPDARLNEVHRPFHVCGIDYAGPFMLRENRRRGRVPMTKAYVVIFTCFHTKAVHLELVSDLTTEAFLATFRRFASRRGAPAHVHSDNATNFVGANRELRDIYEFLKKEEKYLASVLVTQNIQWHFIPPRSPHFGGLWEAAVKSTKRHLHIIMRGLTYTFEEYYTLLVEIEAVLNCRPLTPLSSNPNDLAALTPAHFIVGDTLLQPAQQQYLETPDNRLSRWQHVQKLRQHFWKRWYREYLHQLQTRTKWCIGQHNLEVGTLVLLMEDNAPPLHWPLGRVLQVYPGEDGVVRVASVKTATGTFKRAVKRMCALPLESM